MTREIAETLESKHTSPKKKLVLKKNGRNINEEMQKILNKAQERSKLLLSLRDNSYTDDVQKDQILADYEQTLEIAFPNEVCQEIM
jgi:hypothetical protein